MKQIIIFSAIIFIVYFLASCEKKSQPINDTNQSVKGTNDTILAEWNIVYDSTYSGVGIGNHAVNYFGQIGDYFDFINDSVIYTKEGSVLDTLKYKQITNNTITISSFGIIANGVPEISQISDSTAISMIITAPIVITPGGLFGRKVGLSK